MVSRPTESSATSFGIFFPLFSATIRSPKVIREVDISRTSGDPLAGIAKATVYPVGDLLAFLDRDPVKFIIVLPDDGATEPLIAELGTLFAGWMRFVRSYSRFVEGIPVDVSKGHALARLADHLGIPLGETIGIGDNDNDLELVARAGLGVAMGNASPAVRAAADYIALPVDEEGVFEVIERFVLS